MFSPPDLTDSIVVLKNNILVVILVRDYDKTS